MSDHKWTGHQGKPLPSSLRGFNWLAPDSALMAPGDACYVTKMDRVEAMTASGEIVPVVSGQVWSRHKKRCGGQDVVEICYDRDTGELLATGREASDYYLRHARAAKERGQIIAYASGETDGWDAMRLLEDPDYRVAYGRFRRGTGTGAKR